MNTGKKIFATVQVIDGKIVIDLANKSNYMVMETKDGLTCIVERKSKEYIAVG